MTTTFLGKWRLYLAKSRTKAPLDGYASYALSPGNEVNELSIWFVNHGNNPPLRETNIAFLVSNSKLYFLMNNGKYCALGIVFGGTGFSEKLEGAGAFVLPGHDFNNLPAHFTSKLRQPSDGADYMFDLGRSLPVGIREQDAPVFTITQVTPTTANVLASGNGDGLDFAWIDLTGAKLTNCSLKKAVFSHCTVAKLDLSGTNLSGANLDHVDLTGAIANPPPLLHLKPLEPPSTTNPRTNFAGARVKQSFLGNDWSMLDLTGATVDDLSVPLSSENKPLEAKFSLLTGINQNNLTDLKLQHAVFDHAVLDNVNLNGADLTNASLIQASLHNAVLSNVILKNADLTGAQLGSLGQLFTLPAGFEKYLIDRTDVDGAVKDQFAQHGITLSGNLALTTQAPNRVWQLNDSGNKMVYTIRLEGEPKPALVVFTRTVSASLVNAYMPDAVLTGANLYGVIASGVQFYGSKARLDGSAILEKVEFNDANLSNLKFTQANLFGANLSRAHLFNAQFNKANLSPSADGVATNLSGANLQGADFTDAQLYYANLASAAVAIKLPTQVNPNQGGVYLFSLPYTGDTHSLEQYTAELTNAAKFFFSLNPDGNANDLDTYKKALNAKDLQPLKVPFLKKKITLSANARIESIESDSVWQIIDGTRSYTLWTGSDERGKTELFASPSLTIAQAGFNKRSIVLRWQTSARIDKDDQQWLLDNDSENPKNFSTGYMRFLVKLNGKVLDVYGTALRILRLDDNNRQAFVTEACQVTKISETNMNAETVCPNGTTLAVNQSSSGKKWDNAWLRAKSLPQPPECVPTDFNWCPPPSRRKKE